MNLAKIRAERGLTQRAMAELIGMDAATINRAEKMHHTAKLGTYIKCAEKLGVTLAEIFGEDRSAIEAELLRAFRSIPPNRHAEVIAMLQLARASA